LENGDRLLFIKIIIFNVFPVKTHGEGAGEVEGSIRLKCVNLTYFYL